MKYLTNTWPEAITFFRSVLGLHDAVIGGMQVFSSRNFCLLKLNDVCQYSAEREFSVIYKGLQVELNEFSGPTTEEVKSCIGYDIVEAVLEEHSLWIKTLGGTLIFKFKNVRFMSAENKS